MAGSWVLEDLLPFSARVYWRLFALENEAVWPAQPLLLAAGALLVLCLLRGWRPSGWWLGPALGAAWLWAGWQFVALRYGIGQLGRADARLGVLCRGCAFGGAGPHGSAGLRQARKRGSGGHRAFGGGASGLAGLRASRRAVLAGGGGLRGRARSNRRRHARPACAHGAQSVDGPFMRRSGAVACGLRAHALHDGRLAGLGGTCGPARRLRRLGRTWAKTCKRLVNAVLRSSGCRDGRLRRVRSRPPTPPRRSVGRQLHLFGASVRCRQAAFDQVGKGVAGMHRRR